MFPAGPKTPADAHARTAAATPDQHTAAQAAGPLPVKLSATRQADVSDFKGKVYVNVREYYQVLEEHACEEVHEPNTSVSEAWPE